LPESIAASWALDLSDPFFHVFVNYLRIVAPGRTDAERFHCPLVLLLDPFAARLQMFAVSHHVAELYELAMEIVSSLATHGNSPSKQGPLAWP
jgi:hypothetical protein